ncbi:MAG: transketolase, partial [Epulopiscium sp.]|nr:transketolase [Candidatus Epulonipiscium sp.]
VISMPSMELFEAQTEEYKNQVMPKEVRARLVVEAGSSFGWHKYTGLDGDTICIDTFGASAPASTLFEYFGFTVDHVVQKATEIVNHLQ